MAAQVIMFYIPIGFVVKKVKWYPKRMKKILKFPGKPAA
jgi:hypothetical protein